MDRDGISVDQLLKEHHFRVINTDNVHRISVRCKHITEDTLRYLRKGFNKSAKLHVIFIGEPGVDTGGPCREFFRLLMTDVMCNNSLFEGSDDHRIPLHNAMELKNNTYHYVGKLWLFLLHMKVLVLIACPLQ